MVKLESAEVFKTLISYVEYKEFVKWPKLLIYVIDSIFSFQFNSLSTVQSRLDYLESLESGVQKRTSKFLGLTDNTASLDRSSFQNFVELLNNQLAKYWKDDQRVAVVKLVIQIVKLLSEPGIYLNNKWAHIMSIFFGEFVTLVIAWNLFYFRRWFNKSLPYNVLLSFWLGHIFWRLGSWSSCNKVSRSEGQFYLFWCWSSS